MTFEDYMQAVVDNYRVGGITWCQSYARMLMEHRPDLAEKVKGSLQYDLFLSEDNLEGFLYFVFTNWYVLFSMTSS